MKQILSTLLAASLLATGLASAPLAAQKKSEQGEARKEMEAGNVLSLREIESRVVDPMRKQGHQYLGPAYDSTAMAYRLKFIRDGKVSFVDVDARTGRILRRSQ